MDDSSYLYFVPDAADSTKLPDKKDASASRAFNSVYKKFDHFNFYNSINQSLDSVYHIHPNLNFTDKFNYYDFKCGYYHTNIHDDVKALMYSDSLLNLLHTEKGAPGNDFAKQTLANLAKGGSLVSLKRYNDALAYLYQAKTAAEKSKSADTKGDLYYLLGMVMFKKAEYVQAAHYFITAFQQCDNQQQFTFSKFYRMQEVLNNTAYSYVMANEPDSALLYYPVLNAFINKNKKSYPDKKILIEVAEAVMNGTAGEAYLLKHNAEGEKLLQKSIAINSQPAYDHGSAIQKQLSLANYYLDTTAKGNLNLEKAKLFLQAIGKGLDSVHNEEYAAKRSYLLSRYYDMTGNKNLALSYLNALVDYNKKTSAENKELSETNISGYFQAMQNQYEMQLLKKNSDLEKTYLFIAGILFFFCVTILLLIWRNWQASKKNVSALTHLNKKIKNQTTELERTLEILNKRNLEKDHILKVIAHDLRNPISAIQALTWLMKNDPTLDGEQTECLDLIAGASSESLEMIDTILQIKDDHNPQAIDKHWHNISNVIQNCVNQIKAPASQKNQKVITHLPDDPQFAFIDTDKIQRVIKNLLTNAIKFSSPGGIIQVSLAQKEKDILIKVTDQGIGIPFHLQPKIFDMFTEAKRPGTNNEKTFGLGLSICKQFVEAHGGKIWFNSTENKGTSFYIKLPNEEDTPQLVPDLQKAYS